MRRVPVLPLVAALIGAPLLAPESARADALPYDADTERPVKSNVVVRGVDRFAEHDIVLYPSRCPQALADLDMYGEGDPEWEAALARHGPVDFAVVTEDTRLDWRRGDNNCADSHLYAIPKGLLAELKAMTTADRQAFWRDDPRVARTSYSLPYTTLSAPKRSRLRAVEEVLAILAIEGSDMRVEIDSVRYRFAGDDEQTVPVHSVESPDLPDEPLTPAQLAAAALAVAETTGTTGEESGTPGEDLTTSGGSAPATGSSSTSADPTSTTAAASDEAPAAHAKPPPTAEKNPATTASDSSDSRGPLWLALAAGLVAIVAFAVARRRR